MKILIAYDGSACSDSAIVDLRRAGLPKEADVLVLSVAEAFMPADTVSYGALVTAGAGMCLPESVESETATKRHLKEAKTLAVQAAERLAADFPGWHINTEAWIDAPGSAIVRKAHAWKPDLLVVGSHGRAGISRFVLGSVSEHVLHHAGCSIRVSRHHLHPQGRAIRLLIGVDASEDSAEAVRAVAARTWPVGTEALVMGVADSRIAIAAATTPSGVIPVEIEDEYRRRLSVALHEAVQILTQAGLRATHQILAGRPTETLLARADQWAADCIFVGAKGLNGLERLLLGSVSTAVSARAHCSVEVVRPDMK